MLRLGSLASRVTPGRLSVKVASRAYASAPSNGRRRPVNRGSRAGDSSNKTQHATKTAALAAARARKRPPTDNADKSIKEMQYYQDEARRRKDQLEKDEADKPSADDDPIISFFRQYNAGKDKSKGKDTKSGEESDAKSSDNADSKSGNKDKSSGPTIRRIEFKITGRGLLMFLLGTASVYVLMAGTGDEQSFRETTWQEFKRDYLDKGQVERLVVINGRTVRAYLLNGGGSVIFSIGSADSLEHKLDAAQSALGISPRERLPVSYETEGKYIRLIMSWLPSLVTFGAIVYIIRRSAAGMGGPGGAGGIFSFGKNQAKLFNKMTDVKVRFDEVAGMDEAKEEIMEFVKFLKDPRKYEELGARIPRGAILSGSPGTGKTLLAKATAGEAGVAFYSISASEFIEMYAGVGASRVRSLFKEARAHAPSIVFIDEIDAIGKARGKNLMGGGGSDEREGTLNQLLVEMDGFDTSEHVVVLAGTNRVDVLDPALLRPGRFDRRITIDRPDLEGRKQIYKVHLAKIVLDEKLKDESKFDLAGKLSAMTPGFAGADIANVCNEAALTAARLDSDFVSMDHFDRAIDRVIAGLERKTRVLTPEKKRIVAYHEAGHAVCGWFLQHADPLVKVSIIPRGSAALGYAQYVPPENFLFSQDQFMHMMTMTLGGRVSEELHFDSVTLGASDDFKKVTRMARAMVTQYGMSPKVGHVHFNREPMNPQEPFSQETGKMIDAEVRRLVSEAHDLCVKLLTERKAEVALIAEELLTKEVIVRDDLLRLLGERPFDERNPAFDKYLSGAVEIPAKAVPGATASA